MGWRGVDRAAPGVGDGRRPARPGKYSRRRAAAAATTSASSSARPSQARAHRDPPAAPAEGDAAVRGGAEVVDQGAAVGDALAPGPADLLEQVGDRLGEDDVRGGDGERVAQRRARRLRGAADRDDRRARAHRATVGPGNDAAPAAMLQLCPPYSGDKAAIVGETAHGRALVDLDAGGEQPLAQAERQPGRLHGRRVGIEGAGRGRRARRSARRPRRGQRLAPRRPRPARGRPPTASLPDPVVRGRRRDLQVAAAAKPGVDLLLAAERLDPGDRLPRRPSHGQRPRIPPPLPHIRQREPHHVAEPPVPPTRPIPTDVALEQHDARLRLQLLDVPGSPHPRVPTANHNDISTPLPHQLRERRNLTSLLQPVAVGSVLHRPRV